MIDIRFEPKGLKPDTPHLTDDYVAVSRKQATRGSAKLLAAIRRATPAPVIEPPKFRPRVCRRGRPKNSRKVRKINTKIIRIQEVIAEHFGISVSSMMSPTKEWRFSRPRQIAMYAARKSTTASYPDIGFHFGGRDHTTILHAYREIETRIEERDPRTLSALTAVIAELGA